MENSISVPVNENMSLAEQLKQQTIKFKQSKGQKLIHEREQRLEKYEAEYKFMIESIIYNCKIAADRGEYNVRVRFSEQELFDTLIGIEYVNKISKNIKLSIEKSNIWSKIHNFFFPIIYSENIKKAYNEISEDIADILLLPPYSFKEVSRHYFLLGFYISWEESEEN